MDARARTHVSDARSGGRFEGEAGGWTPEKDACCNDGVQPGAQNAAIKMKATKNNTAPSTGNHSGVGDSSGARTSSAGSS